MVRHIVMWQLKDSLSKEERETACRKIKTDIEGLQEKIPQIRELTVGMNCNPEEEYDIVLNGLFDSLQDIKLYAVHPEHVMVAGFIKGVVQKRCAADYVV